MSEISQMTLDDFVQLANASEEVLTQGTVLLVKAEQCGGVVCVDALWIAPTVWVANCC